MKEDPHIQLMLRFQHGDENAFRELFEIYKIPLINFIFRFCQDRRVSEELSQEVFLRVYTKAATYRPEAKFSTWLYRIATNICLNELRNSKYRYEIELKNVSGNDCLSFYASSDHRSRKPVDEKLAENEQEEILRAAIRELPEKQRIALISSVYERLSYKEIGRRIGCSEGAVKSIIHRSKTALRDILKKELKKHDTAV